MTLLTLTACESTKVDLAAAVAREQQAETAIEALEAIEEPTPEQAAILADYRRLEAQLEAQRKAWEAVQTPQLIERGLGGARDAATGNWFGVVEGIGALIAAAAAAWGGKALASKDADKKLAELEARRNATRVSQGIAPTGTGSAEQAQSQVAQAAKAEAQRQAVAIAQAAATQAAKAEWDRQRLYIAQSQEPQRTAPLVPLTHPSPPSVPADPPAAFSMEELQRMQADLSPVNGGHN